MVQGPASVHVNGTCHVFGCQFSNYDLEVPDGKLLPFEPAPHCGFEIKLLRGGSSWTTSSFSAGTRMWQRKVETLLSAAGAKKKLVVLVIGGTDKGKSSFAMFLANEAIDAGFLPCVVDSDIGQGDLAPPGVMGAAAITKQLVDLRDIKVSAYRFVGSLTPPGFEEIIIRGIFELVNLMKIIGDLIIVNTDGYVANRGASYKAEIVRAIRPDYVVTLGWISGLRNLLGSGPWQILRLTSNIYGAKSKVGRSNRRAAQFNRYIGKKRVTKVASELVFIYKGRPISATTALAIASHETLFVGLGLEGRMIGFGIAIALNSREIVVTGDFVDFDTLHFSKIRFGHGQRLVES